MKKIWLEGMMGLVVGDALGMPVQFCDRRRMKLKPVETMEGYGTYNMPPGTWSDDSSMALATLISIQQKQGIDCEDIMERFVRWNYNGEYTPAGLAFDQGNTCLEAIGNFVRNQNVFTCGKTGERANGNGALMRIMPVCLYAYEQVKGGFWSVCEAVEEVHEVSALTHNHLRSQMACGIYFFMISNILERKGSIKECLQAGMEEACEFYRENLSDVSEMNHYKRLFSLDIFAKCPEEEIKSSGYVVDSLEAAVWSLITTESFEEGLFRAVNLGDDTDTVGAIAGGLAALYYGYEEIPKEWLQSIIRREWIEEVCEWR